MAKNGFNHFQFKQFIHQAIEKFLFIEPTEIQKKMIPLSLKRRKCDRSIANRNRKNTRILITYY